MSRHHLIPSILFGSDSDRCDNTTLLYTLNELFHVLVHADLIGVFREIVDLRQGNLIDPGQAILFPALIIHEQLIVCGLESEIEQLRATHWTTPPSSDFRKHPPLCPACRE